MCFCWSGLRQLTFNQLLKSLKLLRAGELSIVGIIGFVSLESVVIIINLFLSDICLVTAEAFYSLKQKLSVTLIILSILLVVFFDLFPSQGRVVAPCRVWDDFEVEEMFKVFEVFKQYNIA